MPDPQGFLRYERRLPKRRPVLVRIQDWREVYPSAGDELIREQATRCMDCGIPFCHHGCPLGNRIPDWNDLVRTGQWEFASESLHATNNFPEFTGRLCPAPCEAACVLAIGGGQAVTIKQVEVEIINRAFERGFVPPQPAPEPSGRSVGVVGSGPAGLAAAQQLARAGHAVTVYERDDAPGGLMRYGIPDFKLEKQHIDRRLEQLTAEGVRFVWNLRVLRTLGLIDLAVTALYLPMESVLFPKYFYDHHQPAQLGWALIALALGGVAGALCYAALSKYTRRRTAVLTATLTFSAATAGIAFLPPLPVILVLCAVTGVVYGPIQPIYNYVMQTRAPHQLGDRQTAVHVLFQP